MRPKRKSKSQIHGIKGSKATPIKVNKAKMRGGRKVESITVIKDNFDMSIVLKQRLAEARKNNWQPAIIEENGHLVFRKTNSGRKSMAQEYLEERNGYDDEE